MCGIFGIITRQNNSAFKKFQEMTNDLFRLSESRGKEAAGIIILSDKTIHVYKEPISASKFIKKTTYQQLFTKLAKKSCFPLAVIGHARLATNGFQTNNSNNQPVITKNVIGVHNGIIVNDQFLWQKILVKKPRFEVDTEVIFELINHFLEKGFSLIGAIQQAYQNIEGSASLAMVIKDRGMISLTTNTGSLYILILKKPQVLIFASELNILRQWTKKNINFFESQTKSHINHLQPGRGLLINFTNFDLEKFSLTKKYEQPEKTVIKKNVYIIRDYSNDGAQADKTTVLLYRQLNRLKQLKKHDFNYKVIYGLRRCSKCILPETTPFITFDSEGVCNYCHEHKKIKYKGVEALRKLVRPYRSKHGEADCIIAFSGGRDSSYGLHFIKKELQLNPIAYTYDWGMVTDIARCNEARLVGKLGVEHLIVSADITQKRDHIRKHILAWMKKPNLGMVPLFMEGDKQCEYYADKLARQNNIKLIFFCRGNELEKEEFKTGHCGIKNADRDGVIHNMSLSGKIRIAAYYGWQYATNPAYINSSIFDTLFAYFSTYIQKHNYVFLWHYLPWNEKKIIKTLKKEYNWETSKETKQTWRTDDGSSAFYNYIYYMGQGFTENDSFRARQIREGKLTRKEALALVHKENKPRWEALKWYFDRLGLDGHQVLNVVDRMKRLY
jgi:asparagine synthetase B (glutamine-hydrolysing)